MSLLNSSPFVDARVKNYIWLLSGPYDFSAPIEKKYKLCGIFYILWKFIPMSVPKMKRKLEGGHVF